MQFKDTVNCGAVATSVMTAFSYAVSYTKHENFKEPSLLSDFVVNKISKSVPLSNQSGWLIHYSAGCVWAGVYTFMLKQTKAKPTLRNALLFGTVSGLLGIQCWRLLFQKHPSPPKINYKLFFKHLFLAHLVFATVAARMVRKQLAHSGRFRN